MTLKQTIQALSSLGFKMEAFHGCVSGVTKPEPFDFPSHTILTKPERDVFIGQTKTGWNISSHINFRAQRMREPHTFRATILNISGEGSTLEEAFKNFASNFKAKVYDDDEANKKAVQPSENLMGVLPPNWLR